MSKIHIKDHLTDRRICANYPDEDVSEFMGKFMNDNITHIVGMLFNDEQMIPKTSGFKAGSMLLITDEYFRNLDYKLYEVCAYLERRDIAFKYIKSQNKIIINEN